MGYKDLAKAADAILMLYELFSDQKNYPKMGYEKYNSTPVMLDTQGFQVFSGDATLILQVMLK